MAWESSPSRFAMLGMFAGTTGNVFATAATISGTNIVTINCNTRETGVARSFPCLDDDGDAIDLTEYGDLVLVIEDHRTRTDVQTVTDADLTISGDDNNTVAFTPNADVLSVQRRLKFALREVSSGFKLASGAVQVSYAPEEDP